MAKVQAIKVFAIVGVVTNDSLRKLATQMNVSQGWSTGKSVLVADNTNKGGNKYKVNNY